MALGCRALTLKTLRGRWWAFFYKRCLVGFPWYWPANPPGSPAMMEARRLVRRHFGAGHHPVLRTLARVLATLVWPPAVLIHLLQIRCYRGGEVVPLKRMPGSVWAALRHNMLPGEYYAYELWRADRRANIDNYLYSNEAPRLFQLLNSPAQPDPVGDKLAFHEMCMVKGLPTPAILATYTPAGAEMDFKPHSPPERDLFVKPRFGRSGQSAERLRWNGSGFVSSRGLQIGRMELADYLTARARHQRQTFVVQLALSNHPGLQLGTDEALATARLVTGRSTDDTVIPLFGFIYFSRSTSITSQHGYVALIDVASGRLAPPPPPEWPSGKHWNYWVSSDPRETLALPEWEAALEHTKAAHQACANFAFIGWDLAFSDRGPILLEGNANWTADEYQSLSGRPLGSTKFADILKSRLKTCQS